MFLTDIFQSSINDVITSIHDLDSAAELFQKMFKSILDQHAPIKTYQTRKNYIPYLSQESKALIHQKNTLFREATISGNKELLRQTKQIGKQIKKGYKSG